ncbi:hypothetical protein IV454_19345 [Massilia antarctica]|uniref:Uncharacterized protein n=1 Tax=Massilia antarctica TaxID=2765360 RepID=A0AA49A633_9BURK|nr:hypothetical protein [Massilia antarctica]QPI47731.1 hypothetical protein IV454_19345 [Massilia antarctica]
MKSALLYFIGTCFDDEEARRSATAWLDIDPVPVKAILARITPHMRRMDDADTGLWQTVMHFYM